MSLVFNFTEFQSASICTMVLSEGRHEIETARQRLTAAKAQASAAAQMMKSAQLMTDAAQKEVLAASEGLKKAEERWNVINVDVDDDTATASKSPSSFTIGPPLLPGLIAASI